MMGSSVSGADELRSFVENQQWAELKEFSNELPAVALALFREIKALEKSSQFHTLELLLLYASTALGEGLTIEAGWALYFAKLLARDELIIPPQLRPIALFAHPLWHQPVRGSRINLVRPSERHLKFLRATFSKKSFTNSYNQFLGDPDDAADAVVARAQQAPDQLRQLEWLVENKQNETIGLVSIADLVFTHRRGELLLGFPAPRFDSRLAAEAALLAMAVAFHHLGLMKLASYVYAENASAQSVTRALGFVQEGVLRKHIVSPAGGSRSDLYLNGLLRHDFDTGVVQRLWKRLLPDKDPCDLYSLSLKI